MMKNLRAVILMLPLALATACAPAATLAPEATQPVAAASPAAGSEPTPPDKDPDAPVPARPTPDPEMEDAILAAQADLAARENVDESRVELVQSLAVTWPDAGLGCPQPGETYVQIVTPGYLIRLKLGLEFYEYHTDAQAEAIVLCAEGGELELPTLPVSPGEIDDGEPWMPVE